MPTPSEPNRLESPISKLARVSDGVARARVLAQLRAASGRVDASAKALGVCYRTMLRLIARLHLEDEAAKLRAEAGVRGPKSPQHLRTASRGHEEAPPRPISVAEIVEVARIAGDQGVTCDEAEAVLRRGHSSVSARFHEAVHAGLLVATGERRRTRAGRGASAYRASASAEPFGVAAE